MLTIGHENRTVDQAVRRRRGAGIALLIALFILSACAPPAYRAEPRPYPGDRVATPPPPSTQVYFYPKAGQSNDQQSRDHYECYNWAIEQTGFDPGQSAIPRDERIRFVPMPPPGHDTATLAIAGAVLGALIGGPRHAVGGALIGASSGTIVGAASDSARVEAARRQEEAYAARNRTHHSALEAKAADFRRAMGACLEGRGYTVR